MPLCALDRRCSHHLPASARSASGLGVLNASVRPLAGLHNPFADSVGAGGREDS